ncbi:hypothetical protein XELAEV_18040763mg [Xenopus laevis]|uniref:Uncharacterized protein n=1 Tax=Xenopus laevis TaxID=8355 RepID=A0A974H948_XENLA|nr:hypothetical protein XELAEV_18040763mg [Xenopus laevis]
MGTDLPKLYRSLSHGYRAPKPSQISPSWVQSSPPSQVTLSWSQNSPILTGLSFMGTELPNAHMSLLCGHRAPQPSQVSPSCVKSTPTLTGLSFMSKELRQPSQVSPS